MNYTSSIESLLSAPGCKRLVMNSGYLECLQNPNVDLNWDGIAEIMERGILTEKGTNSLLEFYVLALLKTDHRQSAV